MDFGPILFKIVTNRNCREAGATDAAWGAVEKLDVRRWPAPVSRSGLQRKKSFEETLASGLGRGIP